MRRIVIDCRFADGTTGLGRYTRELVQRLVQGNSFAYTLLCSTASPSWLGGVEGSYRILPCSAAHYSIQEQMQLPALIVSEEAAGYFAPHFNVPIRCPVPFVVTIHDLILHRFPNRAAIHKQLAYRVLMRHAVRRARRIIAISDFVEQELDTVYPMHAPITRIRQGIPLHVTPPSSSQVDTLRSRYGLQRPYILYVGNCKQHKNVGLLLQAFKRSPPPGHDAVLVGFGQECAQYHTKDSSVHWLSDVSDEDLRALYGGASLFVTPSLYEGSCLPAAEALACGCPVIGANRGALPELLEGKGQLFEPTVDELCRIFAEPLPPRVVHTMRTFDDVAIETEAVLRQAFA